MRFLPTNNPVRSARKFVASMLLALSVLSCTSHSAMASKSDDEDDHYDARVQGYDPTVEQKTWSTGGAWMMLILTGVACVSVIFKDAKRSHLD